MDYQSITLTVHYDQPAAVWEKLVSVYERMPGWLGFFDGIPFWFGSDENDRHISASVEPGGLLIDGIMEQGEWNDWINIFMTTSTKELGFNVENAAG